MNLYRLNLKISITLLVSYGHSNYFTCLKKTSPIATHLCTKFSSCDGMGKYTKMYTSYDGKINLEYVKGNVLWRTLIGNNFQFTQQL